MPERVKDILFSDVMSPNEKGAAMSKLNLSDTDARTAECISLLDMPPVADDESLVRILEHPIHVDLNKVDVKRNLYYTPSAFRDVYVRGLSVQRLQYSTNEDIQSYGETRALSRSKQFLGTVAARAGDIRTLDQVGQGARSLLSVYATSLPDLQCHADVFSHVVLSNEDKEVVKQIFWDLFDCRKLLADYLVSQLD